MARQTGTIVASTSHVRASILLFETNAGS